MKYFFIYILLLPFVSCRSQTPPARSDLAGRLDSLYRKDTGSVVFFPLSLHNPSARLENVYNVYLTSNYSGKKSAIEYVGITVMSRENKIRLEYKYVGKPARIDYLDVDFTDTTYRLCGWYKDKLYKK